MALVAIGGQIFTIGWTIWWNMHQDGQRSAGQFPALQVKIAVEHPQSSAQPLTKDQNERLIKGIVAIKNVGTSKTNLQLCECVRTEEEADEQRDIFLGPCKAPKAEESIPSCEGIGGVAKGPIVVSRVNLEHGVMHFTQPRRFWLTRSATDRRSKIGLTDEMRPNAEDQFEFLVTAPGPGIYAVMFTSPIDEEESKRMGPAAQRIPGAPLRWDDTKFVEVD